MQRLCGVFFCAAAAYGALRGGGLRCFARRRPTVLCAAAAYGALRGAAYGALRGVAYGFCAARPTVLCAAAAYGALCGGGLQCFARRGLIGLLFSAQCGILLEGQLFYKLS